MERFVKSSDFWLWTWCQWMSWTIFDWNGCPGKPANSRISTRIAQPPSWAPWPSRHKSCKFEFDFTLQLKCLRTWLWTRQLWFQERWRCSLTIRMASWDKTDKVIWANTKIVKEGKKSRWQIVNRASQIAKEEWQIYRRSYNERRNLTRFERMAKKHAVIKNMVWDTNSEGRFAELETKRKIFEERLWSQLLNILNIRSSKSLIEIFKNLWPVRDVQKVGLLRLLFCGLFFPFFILFGLPFWCSLIFFWRTFEISRKTVSCFHTSRECLAESQNLKISQRRCHYLHFAQENPRIVSVTCLESASSVQFVNESPLCKPLPGSDAHDRSLTNRLNFILGDVSLLERCERWNCC
jgi:hypothetical protein